jgi:tryptophan synthase alpha chain
MDGPQRIAAAFAGAPGRAALMPYLMGGFPTLEESLRIGEAYADGGADLIELGVPFSDPLADGPVIHAAGTAALQAGATVAGVLEVCAQLSRRLPVVVMLYANLVFARGPEAFAASLAEAGASGLIVPDLPLEESGEVLAACDAAGVALVPLVAPTTPDDRLAAIGARARGFLYTVSVTGTTGERAALSDRFGAVIARQAAHRRARRARLRHRRARAGRAGRRGGRRRRHRRQPPGARRGRGRRPRGRRAGTHAGLLDGPGALRREPPPRRPGR